jgi:hypothetical protein
MLITDDIFFDLQSVMTAQRASHFWEVCHYYGLDKEPFVLNQVFSLWTSFISLQGYNTNAKLYDKMMALIVTAYGRDTKDRLVIYSAVFLENSWFINRGINPFAWRTNEH